jgi:hypothetical protein
MRSGVVGSIVYTNSNLDSLKFKIFLHDSKLQDFYRLLPAVKSKGFYKFFRLRQKRLRSASKGQYLRKAARLPYSLPFKRLFFSSLIRRFSFSFVNRLRFKFKKRRLFPVYSSPHFPYSKPRFFNYFWSRFPFKRPGRPKKPAYDINAGFNFGPEILNHPDFIEMQNIIKEHDRTMAEWRRILALPRPAFKRYLISIGKTSHRQISRYAAARLYWPMPLRAFKKFRRRKHNVITLGFRRFSSFSQFIRDWYFDRKSFPRVLKQFRHKWRKRLFSKSFRKFRQAPIRKIKRLRRRGPRPYRPRFNFRSSHFINRHQGPRLPHNIFIRKFSSVPYKSRRKRKLKKLIFYRFFGLSKLSKSRVKPIKSIKLLRYFLHTVSKKPRRRFFSYHYLKPKILAFLYFRLLKALYPTARKPFSSLFFSKKRVFFKHFLSVRRSFHVRFSARLRLVRRFLRSHFWRRKLNLSIRRRFFLRGGYKIFPIFPAFSKSFRTNRFTSYYLYRTKTVPILKIRYSKGIFRKFSIRKRKPVRLARVRTKKIILSKRVRRLRRLIAIFYKIRKKSRRKFQFFSIFRRSKLRKRRRWERVSYSKLSFGPLRQHLVQRSLPYLKFSARTRYIKFLTKFFIYFLTKLFGRRVEVELIHFNSRRAPSRFFLNFITTRLFYRYILYDVINPVVRMALKNYRAFSITCKGRFTRAQMAIQRRKVKGPISYSTIASPLDYGQKSVVLKYGTCNLRVWVRH